MSDELIYYCGYCGEDFAEPRFDEGFVELCEACEELFDD